MLRASAAALIALYLISVPAAGQVAGAEGATVGQDLLRKAAADQPSYSDTNGQGGTFNFGGTIVELNELAAGATAETMKGVASSASKMEALEQRGMNTFDQEASREGIRGEVARTAYSSQPMAEDQVLADIMILDPARNPYTGQDLLGPGGACYASGTHGNATPITTWLSRDYTCNIGVVGAACTRQRELSIQWLLDEGNDWEVPDSGQPCGLRGCDSHGPGIPIDDPVAPSEPIQRVTDRITFNGTCETDVVDNQCRARWECTDSEPRRVDGLWVDAAAAERLGLKEIYPGAPKLCWSARMRVDCPICEEDANGVEKNCRYVDVSHPEGNSCGTYAGNAMCQAVGDTCLLEAEDGSCAMVSRRYTCKQPVTIPQSGTTDSSLVCGDQVVQCPNGDCTAGAGVPEEEGMSIQYAMAQMAVMDAIVTDMSNDQKTAKEAKHNGNGLAGNNTCSQNSSPTAGWGFDQDDQCAPEAEQDIQLTASQLAAMEQAQLFRGEAAQCSTSFGGLIDCCRVTNSSAKKLFWKIYAEVNRTNQAARLMQDDSASGYDMMANGGAGMATLSANFTSMRQNVLGGGSSGGVDPTTMTVWQQFMARARSEIKPGLSPKWACSDAEFDLAVQREIGTCSYAGTYCSKKVLGACLRKKEAYCCYKSPMSLLLRRSAEPNGKLTHGRAKSPDCSGIPVDEVDRIQWDQIDFNELVANMAGGDAFTKVNDPNNAATNLTGSGQTAANPGRKDVAQRTGERLDDIDADAVRANIAADIQRTQQPVSLKVQPTSATLAFQSSYALVEAGRASAIQVTRTGSRGAAVASVRVISGSPDVVGLFAQQLQWSEGELGAKHVRLNPPAGAQGRVVLELSASQGAVGTARLITIDVR